MTMHFSSRLMRGAALALLMPFAAAAQEAVFVLPSSETGATVLDPIRATQAPTALTLIFDRLVEQGADQKFYPHLATEWASSPDGMEWTFKLRDDVTFHDGEPFNADTVIWWIGQYAKTDNAYMTAAIERVEAIGPHEVRLVMKHPDPNLLYNLASRFMGIPSPKSYAALGEDFGVSAAVGSGPFEMQSFTPGVETVLHRFDGYTWGSPLSENKGPAKIADLKFVQIADTSAALLEMRTGGVDLAVDVPASVLSQYKALPNVEVRTLPAFGIYYMPINVTVEPFTDVKVREATELAVRPQEIIDSLFAGVGKPLHTFLISSLPEAQVDPALTVNSDPARAKVLLDEAGWTVGADGIRVKDGKPLEASLWVQSDTEFRQMAEILQAQLKDIGMKVDIQVLDPGAIRDAFRKGGHQLAVRRYNWNNADILDWFYTAEKLGFPNISMLNDPKAEELRKKAMTGSATPEERSRNFIAYHEYILSLHTMAPLLEPDQQVVFNASRLSMPEKIDGPLFAAQTVLDIGVK